MRHALSGRFWIAALLLLRLMLVAPASHADELTVIELRFRTADELLPVLRPLAGNTALSGMDYKLLVRGSAADIVRLREAVSVLDRAPRQLRVSVRYMSAPQSTSRDVRVAGTISGGASTRTASDSAISSVQVIEGTSAHIASGQTVPMITAVLTSSSRATRTVDGVAVGYRDIASGFTVTPRMNGERVLLDIATQQQRAADLNSGGATTQSAATTIAGRVGEWIELGGVTSSASEQNSSVSLRGGARLVSTQSDARTLAIKVELVE